MLRGTVKNKEGKGIGEGVFRESKNSRDPGLVREGRQHKMGNAQIKLLNLSLIFFI